MKFNDVHPKNTPKIGPELIKFTNSMKTISKIMVKSSVLSIHNQPNYASEHLKSEEEARQRRAMVRRE